MPAVVALHWNEKTAQYVAADNGVVSASGSVPLEPAADAGSLGRQISEALAPHALGRAETIVALGRRDLEWQLLSLPPCPAEELPDLVRLQADRDFDVADDELGFDYLTLTGDEQTPYQVLTVAVAAETLAKIREVCQAANLSLERVVPAATGWPAIATQTAADAQTGKHLFVAPADSEATLWATDAGSVVLFREFQLAAASGATEVAASMASQLRRTLLALSQQDEGSTPLISLVGRPQDRLAELSQALQEQLDIAVRPLDVTARRVNLANETTSTTLLPLVGIAIDESQGKAPLVDLLHPHQRPQAQINVRTYALAATAASLLVVLLAWMGYAKLRAPLNQAEQDQAELTLLEEPLDALQEYEQRAAAIRDWNAEAPDLLVHLQQLSKTIRPAGLDDEGFPADQDVVLESFDLDKRQLTIDALAKNSRAVQPLETRLRAASYRTQRGKSDPSQENKDYPWHFKSTIEITSASDNVSADDSKPEEPSS